MLLIFIVVIGSIFLFTHFVYGANSDVIITEICPNGCASSTDHQWVEIYNKGNEVVDLSGWKFWEQGTNHSLSTSTVGIGHDFVLPPGEFGLIVHNDAAIGLDYDSLTCRVFDSSFPTGLNKSGEEIGLKFSTGADDFVQKFSYKEIQSRSMELKDANLAEEDQTNWVEHPTGNTVGVMNYWWTYVPPVNIPPTAVIVAPVSSTVSTTITFSSAGSSDSDGSIVSTTWNLGDGNFETGAEIHYAYTSTGTFTVQLTVQDDGGALGFSSQAIQIFDQTSETPSTPTTTPTTTEQALIRINEFVSDPATGEHEWIELYNSGSSTIDLTGFTLYDGSSQIFAPTSSITSKGFAVIELSSSKLNNDGDLIFLKDPSGNVIDQIAYGNWDDGNMSDNALATSDPNSVARKIDGQDSNIDNNDFAETTSVTKGFANGITSSVHNSPSGGGGGGGGSTYSPVVTNSNVQIGDVVINEIVSDSADGQEEFVELYNKTSNTVFLENWFLKDGSETKTILSGNISSHSYFVIDEPKGALNNAGDFVALIDNSGKEIDKLSYGNWNDGNILDNATVAYDPNSLSRKTDGQDTNNDKNDFGIAKTITKGSSNSASSVEENIDVNSTSAVLINEVFPNPKGGDEDDEFIELFNQSDAIISLIGWSLSDATDKKYIIPKGEIGAGGYMVFKRSATTISLNNSGKENIKLYNANGSLVQTVSYSGTAEEDQSYARRDGGTWTWTSEVTSGAKNIFEGAGSAPDIVIDAPKNGSISESISFDASDTLDPSGGTLSFVWDFGDGVKNEGSAVQHAFQKEGKYSVKLKVGYGSGKYAEKTITITIGDSQNFVGSLTDGAIESIKISEVLPNPTGSDDAEFVELVNPTNEEIDLSFLKLDDEDGGSKPYVFKDGTAVSPGERIAFKRKETGLALNNTNDEVRLLYADNSLITKISYEDAPEGYAYVQNQTGAWVWTSTPTPGQVNILSGVKLVKGVKITSSSKSSSAKKVGAVIETTLEKIREQDIGDRVRVKGTVAVLPGVFGTQYFYIIGSPGVQVYMFKKDFPDLAVGDKIEVTGELTQASGELRLKTSEKADIKKVDHVAEIAVNSLEISEIGEGTEGMLAQAHGEITEIKTSYMYIDDGSDEIKVYFKKGTNIKKDIFQEGDIVSVTGIVQQTKSGYQLLPRSQADIVKTGVAEDAVKKVITNTADAQRSMAETYLTATAGGLSALLVALGIRAKGKALVEFVKKLIKR